MVLENYDQLLAIIKERLEERKTNGAADRFVVAIDGKCGSGKTTAVRNMAAELGCEIIQMDDFYLHPEMRTPERRQEPGGNVDYVRFAEEVLPNIKSRESFTYRKYDAPNNRYIADIEIKNPDIVFVEGAYSLRPEFRPYYDLSVFSNASYNLQIERLTKREGEYVEEYKNMWIPLENFYHEYFNLAETCDIIINVG